MPVYPTHENDQVAFDNVTPTRIEFSHRCGAFKVWSADDSFYLGMDEAAAVGMWLVPMDTIDSNAIPCKYISILGQNGSGIVNYMALYQIHGVHDTEAELNRGGIHLT